jgi:hypothetical protein
MNSPSKKRRGTVAVMVAATLTVLIGFVALALDGGLLQDNRRYLQAAADAAALAGAQNLYVNYGANQGTDPGNHAWGQAIAVAASNGYNNDGTTNKVTVNIPPLSGIHTGMAGYVEVIVEYYQTRFFSTIWGGDKTTVRARAVAIGQWTTFNNGIMVLDPTSPGSLTDNGSGTVTVSNANVIVNSSDPAAVVSTGGGNITAPNFYITGVPGYSLSGGGQLNGNVTDGQIPTPDPLAYLTPPDPTTMTLQSKKQSTISGNSAKIVTIWPGVYQGGISVSGQVTLIMMPGIYYMDGGGFSFTGQGNLTATGVMIYSAPQKSSDVININGNGTINFTPPTSGPYAGIALWQARSATNTIYLTGNGSSQLFGTVYGQHATLSVSGNGAGDVLGSQYISYDVGLSGNGNFYVSWLTNMSARTRLIYLVE